MDLRISGFEVFKHHVHITYQLDDYGFETKIIYPTVDLLKLSVDYPADQIESIFASIAFFEGFKYCLVFPDKYDVSAIASTLPESAVKAFEKWFPYAWSQHLFENKRFDYKGPKVIFSAALKTVDTPCAIKQPKDKVLACNGGGKDSFVMMRMLQEAGFEYDSYQFARTEYGKLRTQQDLMDLNASPLQPAQSHRISVYDDFTDGMFANIYWPQVGGESTTGNPCQVGTPEGMFEAIPVCLAHGIPYIAVGNEKSADEGSLYSEELGHQVNHQWIKSLDAETQFSQFIAGALVSNIEYFSALKPIQDTRIYQLFSDSPEALTTIHSCNIEKPWCKKCPKCAYVWANLAAVFDYDAVFDVFKINLLDDPDLILSFRQLLGLENQNAFECVGEIHETRLAFKKLYEKGIAGKAMDIFIAEVLPNMGDDYWTQTAQKYLAVDDKNHHIPDHIFSRIYGSERLKKTA